MSGAAGGLIWFLVALTLALFGPSPALALEPGRSLDQYSYQTWNTSQGLPQNAITALLQTADGYVWIGTQAGLARFDGVEFRILNRGASPMFSDQFITALAEDTRDNLWIGTREGLIRRRGQVFEKLTVDDGLPSDYIRSLKVDRRGVLWVGTYGGGLVSIDDGRIDRFGPLEGLSDGYVRVIFEDREGALWIGTSDGLDRFQNGQFVNFGLADGLDDTFVRAICEDIEGRLWVGTEGGLYRSTEEGRFERFQNSLLDPGLTIRSLHCDRFGTLWLGTNQRGLIRLFAGEPAALDVSLGLTHNSVWSLLEDREGSLWVGTRSGLNQLKDGNVTTFTSRQGLSVESVRSIYQDQEGLFWVGGDGGGVQLFENGRFVRPPLTRQFADARVRSLLRDRQGVLWAGTREGLIRFAPSGARLLGVNEGLSSERVNTLVEGPDSQLWIGTAGGLSTFDGKRIQPVVLPAPLSSDLIRVLLRDQDGSYWIGTEAGLNHFKDGEIEVYSEPEGLAPSFVLALYQDARGDVWIGTTGGLSLLRNGKILNFIELSSQLHTVVFQILEDDRSNLWLSTSNGIIRVGKDALLAVADGRPRPALQLDRFDESDGMRTSECNGGSQPAGWRTADGKLWFPSIKGIAMIDPAHSERDPKIPSVQIESLIVGQTTYPQNAPVRIPHGMREFQIRYAAPSFIAPERLRYRYQLEGYNDHWVEAASRREAFFTNLPPGEYTFRVRASFGKRWDHPPAVLNLVLEPAFYQASWFPPLMLILGMLAIFGAFRLRVRSLERRRTELQSLVHDRTRQLEAANRTLKQLANIDDLTGVQNHRRFQEELRSEWRRMARVCSSLSLIVIDIDFFKAYNDTYGHLEGDNCLKAVAEQLKLLFRRQGEVLARYGGEEFVALLPEVQLEEASLLAEKIRASVEELAIEHAASPIGDVVTVSVGVASFFPTPSTNANQLFEAADMAMYKAKRSGRNRVCLQEDPPVAATS